MATNIPNIIAAPIKFPGQGEEMQSLFHVVLYNENIHSLLHLYFATNPFSKLGNSNRLTNLVS
jgi:hypothetical protein